MRLQKLNYEKLRKINNYAKFTRNLIIKNVNELPTSNARLFRPCCFFIKVFAFIQFILTPGTNNTLFFHFHFLFARALVTVL